MKSALLDQANRPTRLLERTRLTSGHAEKWLQQLLFDQPDLVPTEEIDPGAGPFIPLIRELALPKVGGHVFLDVMGVTPRGRLVLIECKLWRNPQARREVIAQILEYAALLRRWSYADLTAQLKAKHGFNGENPIYDHVKTVSELSEAAFTDKVAQSLRTGDFDLFIAGDGIREDMSAITDHLRYQGARLALLEFQVWSDGDDIQLVVPSIPFRTEVHHQRILTYADGTPVMIDQQESDYEVEAASDPSATKRREQNRSFWQRFIDQATFDHPEQTAPTHGGDNWVRMLLPNGASLTAFRTADRAGIFIPKRHSEAINQLLVDKEEIQREVNLPNIRFETVSGAPEPTVAIDKKRAELQSEQEELNWLVDAANRLINSLRPRLGSQ